MILDKATSDVVKTEASGFLMNKRFLVCDRPHEFAMEKMVEAFRNALNVRPLSSL
jgi:hypothetical protein